MSLDKNWYTEAAGGFAMSLEITEKLHEEQTPYQKLEIFETRSFGRLMTLDGLTMLTSRDNFVYHEMMSHPALFYHSNPEHVAIVGGGDCGTLREVLKHDSVVSATQIELDERVTRVSEQYFPELCESNNDERARLLFEDAIAWMRNAKPKSLDVIILDTTDPVGQAKRLFAEPFYRDCLNALREGGIVVAQSESPLFNLDLIQDMRGEMEKADFTEMRTLHFPQVTYPSGWWTATMARKGQGFGDFREQAARNRSFQTRYYNADIHTASAALPQFMQDVLRQK
ncbi:MAG: polyamine aminopropyltransferase [Gammaproteobacteria bacterium]